MNVDSRHVLVVLLPPARSKGGASSNVGRWRGWRKSFDNALFLLIDQRQRTDGDGDGRFPYFSVADDGNDETPAAAFLLSPSLFHPAVMTAVEEDQREPATSLLPPPLFFFTDAEPCGWEQRWNSTRKSFDNALFLLIDQRQRVDGDGDGRFPYFLVADDGNDETPATAFLLSPSLFHPAVMTAVEEDQREPATSLLPPPILLHRRGTLRVGATVELNGTSLSVLPSVRQWRSSMAALASPSSASVRPSSDSSGRSERLLFSGGDKLLGSKGASTVVLSPPCNRRPRNNGSTATGPRGFGAQRISIASTVAQTHDLPYGRATTLPSEYKGVFGNPENDFCGFLVFGKEGENRVNGNHFLWRCMRFIPPVREILKTRHVWAGGGCPLCAAESETMDHLFCGCPLTKQKVAGLREVWHEAYSHSNLEQAPSSLPAIWSPPAVNYFKCNVDAATYDNGASYGVVVRDHNGRGSEWIWEVIKEAGYHPLRQLAVWAFECRLESFLHSRQGFKIRF
nr:uncharacterized protein LOC109154171 [Ipomoea batatas]